MKNRYAKYIPEDHIIEASEDEGKAVVMNIIEKKYGASATAKTSQNTSSFNDNGELIW